jgi:DNA-binding transcriptional regulator WhiA
MQKDQFSHPEITKELLTEEWVNNRLSQQEIADKYKVGLWLIESRIKHFKLTGVRSKIKHLVDQTHVTVDSHVFWYLMGLVLSDGHIDEPNQRITIQLTHDLEILEVLAKYYGKDRPLPIFNYRCKNNNIRYVLTLSDKPLIDLFHSLGISGFRKTYVTHMPDPGTRNMFNLMLRGFIDGDGSIRFTKNNGYYLHFRFYIESENLKNDLVGMFEKYYGISLYQGKHKQRNGFRVESPALKKDELVEIYSDYPDLSLRRKRNIVQKEVDSIMYRYHTVEWENWNH